ncbi:MAG: TetR family transcriptional regulator [Proteobacteria bacterium SG_bin9]|nr:MAG: TetR family transcriptional regulator [Proteobacteria bacterium SG_bin9]
MSPAQRERQIVDGAIAFFAEVGLEGQTRELARRLGITQPLLYRYFPSKEELLERVYDEVYMKRWKPEWEALIADRSLSIGERFRRFEKDYQRTIMTYDWLRIFFSSGLKGTDLTRRYLTRVRDIIFTPVLAEMRREFGLPSPAQLPLSAQEYELMFGIHGALVYVGIRRFIYNMDVPTDQDLVFDTEMDAFMAGVGPVMRRLVAEQQAIRRARKRKAG